MKNLRKTISLLVLGAAIFVTSCSRGGDDPDHTPPAPPSNADEYVTWAIGSFKGYLAEPPDSLYHEIQNGRTLIYGATGFSSPVNTGLYTSTAGTAAGTFPLDEFYLVTGGKYYVPTAAPMQVTFATYGSPGQYITGSFTGTLRDSLTTQTYPVNGNFRVRRTN